MVGPVPIDNGAPESFELAMARAIREAALLAYLEDRDNSAPPVEEPHK